MKKTKLLFALFFALLMIFNMTLSQSASAFSNVNNEDDEVELPYEEIDADTAAPIVEEARASIQFSAAKEIASDEGYEVIPNKTKAVHLKDAGNDIVYFYLKKKGELSFDENVSPFIAVEMSQKKLYLVQLPEYDKDNNLHTKIYKNGKLVMESHNDQDGLFLEGSYAIDSYGVKKDLTTLNQHFKSGDVIEDQMKAQFSWDKFWDCLKKNSKEQLPLRSMLMGACYYICLTGPPGCITCTVINGGLSAGTAGYCVYKVW